MTLFEKLIARQLPCHVVHEDAHTFAFLDIEPLAPGHTLLVPKRAVATLDQLDEAHAAALGRALPRLCRAIRLACGVNAYNVLQNNGAAAHQAVPHVHFHIIPRPDADRGLQLHWRPAPLGEGAAALADAIAGAMGAAP